MVIISQDGRQAYLCDAGMVLSVTGRYLFLEHMCQPEEIYDTRIGEFGSKEEAKEELMRLASLYAAGDAGAPLRVARMEEE